MGTTNPRPADATEIYSRYKAAAEVLECRMVGGSFEMPQICATINADMFPQDCIEAAACFALYASQAAYTVFEVAQEANRIRPNHTTLDKCLQKSMQHPDVDAQTAADFFIGAYGQYIELQIANSVPYWLSQGMGTDEVRREADAHRKKTGVSAYVKADNGKEVFEANLMKSLDGVRIEYPIKPHLSALQKSIGYWRPGDFAVIGGRTGMGKSYIGLNQIHFSATEGHHCQYINLENDSESVQARLWQFETGDFLQNPFYNLSDAKRMQYVEAWERVKKLPIESMNPGRDLHKIVSCIRRSYYEKGTALVVLDYIQLVRSGIKGTKLDDHAEVSATIRQLALELQIPIIALAQIGRGAENSTHKRPTISDLRGAGDFEMDATFVGLLYRPSYYRIMEDENGNPYAENYADVTIGKGRNTGPSVAVCRFDHINGFYNTPIDTSGGFEKPAFDGIKNRSEDVPF